MSPFIFGEYVHGIHNRNRIERLPEFPDCYGYPVTDAYTSIFRFDYSLIEHRDRSKEHSVSGFGGRCRATGLHFDFDSPHDDASLKDAREFIEKVLSTDKYGCTVEHLDIYFSGNKGFHILLCNEEIKRLPAGEMVPDQIKRLCTALAGTLPTFDRTVYDRTRLFRLINSRHRKSGLYKIPLYPAELFTHDLTEIKTIARKQRRLSESTTIRQFLKRGGHNVTA